MRNMLCIAGMRITMKIRNMFVDIFVALYLWNLSDGSVPTLCRYYSTFVGSLFITMIICAPSFSKRRIRKYILMFSCILQFLYLLLVYRLGTECVNHIMLIATASGVSGGSYYCVYNVYESEGVSNEARHSFMGKYEVVSALVSILFPIASGFLIQAFGMRAALIAVMVITVISFIFVSLYVDRGASLRTEYSYKKMIDALRNTENGWRKLRAAFLCDFVRGMLNSYGSFDLFISVWTMTAFATASKMGTVSGLSTAFTVLFGIVFARRGSKLHKKSMTAYYALRAVVIVSMIAMVLTGNVIYLLVMTLAIKCSDPIEKSVYGCALQTIANSGDISKYKSEFFVVLEHGLSLSRVSGYSLLWFWGYVGNTQMLAACIITYSIFLIASPIIQDRLYRMAYKVD